MSRKEKKKKQPFRPEAEEVRPKRKKQSPKVKYKHPDYWLMQAEEDQDRLPGENG